MTNEGTGIEGRGRPPVGRTRLDDLLASGERCTLVVGPAGAGKSFALASWAATCDRPVRWVHVGDLPPHPLALWRAVADAFSVSGSLDWCAPTNGVEPPVGDVVLRLTEAISTVVRGHEVLIVDGLDDVGADSAGVALGLFVSRLTPSVRLLLAGRHQFPLPLDRMRVQGELLEVDFDDLRFATTESYSLLAELVPDAEADFVDDVVTLADGWAAALALGAAAWRRRRGRVPDIESVTLLIGDYVRNEVLARAVPSLAGFLVDIAIVDSVNAALADAITGRHDAAELLARAERSLTFVQRIGFRGDYQLHSAFRSALVAEGDRRDAERATDCRRRAAAWLERAGEPVVAIEQWLRAGDPASAVRVLAHQQLGLYDAGLEQTIRTFVTRLAGVAPATDVAGMVELAWCQLLVDRDAFRRGVDDAQWWAAKGGEPDARTSQRLHALQAVVGLVSGDLGRCATEARAALDAPPEWWNDPLVAPAWNNLARTIALDERWNDASDEVREITVALRREPNRLLVLEATRSLGEANAGRPIEALRVIAGIRASAAGGGMVFSRAELALAEIIARREVGDAPNAITELEQLVVLDVVPSTYVRGLAAFEVVLAHLDQGAATDAATSLMRLESIVEAEFPGPAGETWIGRAGTLVALELGEYARADRFATGVSDGFWGPVSRARVSLAIGARHDAEAHLAGAVPRGPRHQVILGMMLAQALTDHDAVTAAVDEAVTVATRHGLMQTMASVGRPELVEPIAWRLPPPWMDWLRRSTVTARPGVPMRIATLEPLTVRERDVLRFLPSRLTLKEIAAELHVSVNTLKFHLKVIYRKLGVNSRAEAADLARAMGRVDAT